MAIGQDRSGDKMLWQAGIRIEVQVRPGNRRCLHLGKYGPSRSMLDGEAGRCGHRDYSMAAQYAIHRRMWDQKMMHLHSGGTGCSLLSIARQPDIENEAAVE